MTDHLPECPWPEKPCGPDHEPMHDRQPLFCVACLTECDCERLRACEQRVLDAIDLSAANVQYQKVGYKFGYAAGLDAAREAVVAKALHSPKCWALLPAFNERDCNCACAYALAAIDALREKP